MPVEVLSDLPGDAATRKLLRSVFMKGLAAAVVESLSAAELAGCEPWLRAQIVSVLTGADESLVDRLVHGSKQHARRRVDEMDAAAAVVADLGPRAARRSGRRGGSPVARRVGTVRPRRRASPPRGKRRTPGSQIRSLVTIVRPKRSAGRRSPRPTRSRAGRAPCRASRSRSDARAATGCRRPTSTPAHRPGRACRPRATR